MVHSARDNQETARMASDTTAPSLISISLSAPSIDPQSGETTLVVTAQFADDVSGIFDGTFADGSGSSSPQIRFVSPSGQIVTGMFDILNPLSGGRLNGEYQATITLGANAEAGVWQVQYLLLNDEAGNSITLNPGNSLALAATSFSVINAHSDTTAPSLTSISLSAPSIDPQSGETTLVVTAQFADDVSGIFDGT